MTVKTGSSWAGTFTTLDATGALATPSTGPAGVLYVDGVANAAEVTITGSNPYKFAVTLPSLTAGQRVDMYITATIATIATAGIVASEQADTFIVSDIETLVDGLETMLTDIHDTDLPAVKSDTAAILTDTDTTLDALIKDIPTNTELATALGTADDTTLAAIAAVDTKIDTIDNFLDTEVAAILADTNELQTDLVDGGRLDLLIDAIKSVIDNIHDTDLPAVKTETAAILEDTGTTLHARLILVEQILRNKLITDPATGVMTLYDDAGNALLTANVFENAAGTQAYRGQGAERRERLA